MCVHSMTLCVYCINPLVHKTISTIYYLCDECDEENGCNSGILGYWFCLFAVSHTASVPYIGTSMGIHNIYRPYKELYTIQLLRHKVIHCILIIYYIICIIAVGCAVLGGKLSPSLFHGFPRCTASFPSLYAHPLWRCASLQCNIFSSCVSRTEEPCIHMYKP